MPPFAPSTAVAINAADEFPFRCTSKLIRISPIRIFWRHQRTYPKASKTCPNGGRVAITTSKDGRKCSSSWIVGSIITKKEKAGSTWPPCCETRFSFLGLNIREQNLADWITDGGHSAGHARNHGKNQQSGGKHEIFGAIGRKIRPTPP